ncbi:MAG TPA: hypothetical protein VM282_05855 [Acidimicrobiales bacterium]|nr:hypothetical protein [Acidimicrobiales bacterium]
MAKLDWRPWPLRVAWALLPLGLGPLLADALDPRDDLFRRGVSVALWLLWALALLATAVPRPLTLTLVRIIVPGSVLAAAWAALAHGAHTNTAVGLGAALVATVCALLPTTGDAFADGASYGDERRFLLRPPGAFLLGPIELGWLVVVAGLAGGPLLLLARHWFAGAAATVAGFAVVWWGWRSLHALSNRWLVFVPAGVVLHDALVLAEPTLFARANIVSFGPAPATTDALDLSANALGLALQVDLEMPQTVAVVAPGSPRHRVADARSVTRVMFAPTRPGAVAAEARARQFSR